VGIRATREPSSSTQKINSKKVAKIQTPKNATLLPIFTTQNSTTSPQISTTS
jgi:hypothetical protein